LAEIYRTHLDVYGPEFESFLKFRREDGILEARLHTDDGPLRWNLEVAALAGGSALLDVAREAAAEAAEETRIETPVLTNALDPVSYRDFMVFQEHFSFGYRWQNARPPGLGCRF